MNKEELEKEAEEIYLKTDKEFMDCQDEGEIFNLGYLAGAEPREKHIEELKLKLGALEGQTPWKDIKDKSKLIERLSKATELIELFLSDNRIMQAQFESEEQANIWFEHIHQAEQFLRETE